MKLKSIQSLPSVKLAVRVPGELHVALTGYAVCYRESTGQAIEVRSLVVQMLEQFMRTSRRRRAARGRTACRDPWPWPARESLPERAARAPPRGAWFAASVRPEVAALGRARGYLGGGPCVGGAQPVMKPVVALAGLPLPHAVWGRPVGAADKFSFVSTRVPNSRDSQYVGPFSVLQIGALRQFNRSRSAQSGAASC